MLHFLFILLIAFVTSVQSECSATLNIKSYLVNNGPKYQFKNHDLIVLNSGTENITAIYVRVVMPSDSSKYFVAEEGLNTTTGMVDLPNLISVGATQFSGRIVFSANAAAAPFVEISRVECASAPAQSESKSITSLPTDASAPTTASTSTPVRVHVHPASSNEWLALSVQDARLPVVGLFYKDDCAYPSWAPMTETKWGYWMFTRSSCRSPNSSSAFQVKIVSNQGTSIITHFSSLTPNLFVHTQSQF